MIMKIKKDECDMRDHLVEKIKFLKNSIMLFDNGDYQECNRIALSIRVLVHDSKNYTSLLKHLKKKDISFYDNASSYFPGNLLPTTRLVALYSTKEGESTYLPNKDFKGNSTIKVPFSVWWNEIVIDDSHGNLLKRKDLILSISNQDGGAHVDLELNIPYGSIAKLKTQEKGIKIENGKGFRMTLIQASVRQIADELIRKLIDEFSDMF